MKKCVHLTQKESRCNRGSMKGKHYCSLHDSHLRTNHSEIQHTEDDLYEYPTEIVKYLFLGSESKVGNSKWLKKHNIKTVVNATNDLMYRYDNSIKFYMWGMRDLPSENITPYLEKTAKIIDASLKRKEGILIHCHMGISRSASLVWYWLATRKYNGDYKAALIFLQSKRWIVNPNRGFLMQVEKYISKK
jgi:protein-tyrosine phosphatase